MDFYPKVSIIIPTYNRAHLILSVLKNISAQTYDNLEIIIIDDGSSDDTLRLVSNSGTQGSYILSIDKIWGSYSS